MKIGLILMLALLPAVAVAKTAPRPSADADERLYEQSGRPEGLMSLRQRLDGTLADLTRTPAPKRPVWGCDALFTTPAVYARMSVLTNDPKYLQAMDTAWGHTSQRLWDADAHLYTCRQKTVRARDEGAVIAGLARVLDVMPVDFPSQPRYVEQYQAMAARLITLQREDGLWPPNLLEPRAKGETAGTTLITYALAWGINHGLLDRQTYLPPVLKAWAALTPPVRPGDVFIMAGSEIARLDDPATPLPSPVIVHTGDLMMRPRETERQPGMPTREPTRAAPSNPITDDPSDRPAGIR